MDDQKFINPYNFISLPAGKCKREKRDLKASDLSGYIECTAENINDLFIPSSYRKGESGEHQELHFFHYADGENDNGNNHAPVIPGSEIRGVIRNVYETLTNSCMSSCENLHFTKRDNVGDAKEEGLLVYDENSEQWTLHNAEKIGLVGYNQIDEDGRPVKLQILPSIRKKEGELISFTTCDCRPANRPNKGYIEKVMILGKGPESGYFHRGEKFGNLSSNKSPSESIFVDLGNIDDVSEYMETAIEGYKEVLNQYNDPKSNKCIKKSDQVYQNVIKCLKEKRTHAVYYRIIKRNNRITSLIISPAQIGRNVMNRDLDSILDAMGYTPCSRLKNKGEKKLCPGCRLFGALEEDANTTSRVRFSDATNIRFSGYRKDRDGNNPKLKTLSTPKYSNSEMYLHLNGTVTGYDKHFSPDYYKNNKARDEDTKYVGLLDNECQINGRKFYWHHKNAANAYDPERKETKLNKTVEPLKPGSVFSFRVYFDHITREELDTLCFSLDLGSDGKHGHKIGMGKPLGLGSVLIHVDRVMVKHLSEQDPKFRNMTEYERSTELHVDKMAKQKLMTITNFEATGDYPVSYPYLVDNNNRRCPGNGFDWYTEANEIKRKGNPYNKDVNLKVLPDSLSDAETDIHKVLMNALRKEENQKKHYGNNRSRNNKPNNYGKYTNKQRYSK